MKKTTRNLKSKNQKKNKIISIILYLLPILFFAVSYFLITTSGEDVHQGAGNLRNGVEFNVANDAINAFHHSGRITDMYAWSIIDLFDYQFQFGVDTIFRLIDVLLISSSLYLITYLILDRKPKLQIKDALIFCGAFVALVFSIFGRRLYTEFSMIHNYVPLVFITALFSIPYVKLLLDNRPKNKHHLLTIFMLPLGIIFGLSTTVTPLAFLITAILYLIIKRKHLPKIPAWFYLGLAGIAIGFCISYFLSSSMTDYTTNATAAANFDYVSLSDFFNNPFGTIPRLLFHLVYNFGMLFLPLFGISIIAVIFTKTYRQVFTKHPFKNLSPNTKKLLLSFSLFIFIHTFATIQIKTPPRILIPAYIAGVILIFKIFASHVIKRRTRLFNVTIISLTISALVIHIVLLSIYHTRMAVVLEDIRTTTSDSYCIEHPVNNAPRIPVINLSQEFLLVDWGYPEPIYGKPVVFCITE